MPDQDNTTNGAGNGAAAPASTRVMAIGGQNVTVRVPYRAGHPLNENEANTLNQTYAENVRNNVAGKLKAAQAAWEKDEKNKGKTYPGPSTEVLTAIQAYADAYEFGAVSARKSEPVDPLEREAHRYAKEIILAALRGKGVKVKDLKEGQLDGMIEEVMKQPAIQKEAKRRVDAKSGIGADLLSSLGIGGGTPTPAPEPETGASQPPA